MTYINEGESGYNGLLVGETATLKLGDRSEVELKWQEYSDVTTLGASGRDAIAQVIPGASVIAHETRFFPRDEACSLPCDVRKNFLAWKDFAAAVGDSHTTVSIKFTATLRGQNETKTSAKCRVFLEPIDREDFARLGLAKTNATSLVCSTIKSEQ